jgi:membrane complex biogenesis BtpA family protein
MKNALFNSKLIIGMVHLLPLPGSPAYEGDNKEIEERAIADAHTLIDGGVDAISVENFSDWPQYSTEVPLEAYSLMLNIVTKIKSFCPLPLGVNIEMNAFRQEWIMAYATGADFIRVEAFVDNRAGSFGYLEACSTPLAQLMKQLPAKTLLFTDVHTAETYGCPEVAINELAGNAINHDSSAIVVTENDQSKRITVEDVKSMREKIGDFPIIVGAGVHTDNIMAYLEYADGVIIGRGFKKDGRVDAGLVKDYMTLVRSRYTRQ